MKKIVSILCFLAVFSSLLLGSCFKKSGYEPSGGFYVKTSSNGVSEVIDLELESKTFTGDGDLRIRATAGFGCLPGTPGYGEGAGDTFKVEYLIIEAPWVADKRPAWEMVTEYDVSFYDEMFFSTETSDGEFYPTFKEDVTLTFPAEVEKGYLEIKIFDVVPERGDCEIACLRVYFEREGDVLTLEP